MTYRAGLLTGAFATLFLIAIAIGAWWIAFAPKPAGAVVKPAPPATVGTILKEESINGIKLTPEAETRLGIKTSPVEKKSIRRSRNYGGEVTIPMGHTIPVAAPLGGELRAPSGGVPQLGTNVRKGQPIILLLPLLTPEARTTIASARVDADGQVNNANTQLEAARIALDRAKRLLNELAGSQRGVDEAQALYDIAQKTLEAATARRELLVKVSGEVERGTAAPLTIDAPVSGFLRTVAALPGQNVPAGAALFEVVDLSRVWIRVPVYVGDLRDIAVKDPAKIGDISARAGEAMRSAKPVPAPPSANAMAATADLYYELENHEAHFAPGQRVGVTLPLVGESESATLPWSAVIHDVHGSTWVYEQTAPHQFARRRVQIRHVNHGVAELATGPPVGTLVVATGAAELFGTEVGFSK